MTAAGRAEEADQSEQELADAMMRDLLTVPQLLSTTVPPRVIVDSQYFRNESSEIIDKKLITDRLRITLNRAAAGRWSLSWAVACGKIAAAAAAAPIHLSA